MKSEWYYSQSGQQMGPVTAQQLKQLAMHSQLLPTDLVWKAGMIDWTPAQELKGLFKDSSSPPPPMSKPQKQNSVDPKKPLADHESRVRTVGKAQQTLIWLILIGMAMVFVATILSSAISETGYAIVFILLHVVFYLVVIPVQFYCVYRLADGLKMPVWTILFYMVMVFIPFIGIFFLVALNMKATRLLQEAGIEVGFLGVKSADLPS